LVAARRLSVVDPCEDCARLLPRLREAGWLVHSRALEVAGEQVCDVGLARLRRAHLEHPEPLKRLISRSGTEWIAVLGAETLQLPGAADFIGEWFFDYHTLPFDLSRVGVALGRAYGMARLRGKLAAAEPDGPRELLGNSRSIVELRHLLARLAPLDTPLLVCGESGSGRELAARIVHRLSPRADAPLLCASCAALDEAELFGREQSPGMLEQAAGGSLVLAEIDELPLHAQARLLRSLQEGRANVRLIATCRPDPEAAVREGRLREDLYYLLGALQVRTTPLLERREDIACLAGHIARRYATELGRRPRSFSERAIHAMADHDWP